MRYNTKTYAYSSVISWLLLAPLRFSQQAKYILVEL